jgi:hypothetical protein
MDSLETVFNDFVNTLSFMRVAAFSISHVALAMAISTLSAELGGVGQIVTADTRQSADTGSGRRDRRDPDLAAGVLRRLLALFHLLRPRIQAADRRPQTKSPPGLSRLPTDERYYRCHRHETVMNPS